MDLSVVVPCYNEERALPRLHAALGGVLPALAPEHEIVVVDDGSADGTLSVARSLAAADPRFRYVALSRNFGKEAALLAGLQRARGDRVAIMDADLQHPPELLGRMLALLDAGHDQVVACRDRRGEPWSRTVPARVFYRLFNRLAEVPMRDGAGDFRVLTRRALRAVLAMPEQHRFTKGLFAWVGFDTAHVPLPHVPRRGGRSQWSWRGLVEHAVDGVTSFHHRPLRFAAHLGAVVLAGAAGCLLAGARPLSAGLLASSGLQLVCLGVLGEYLGRIHVEAKRRPHYVVRETGGGPSALDRGQVALCPVPAEIA